MAATAPGGPRVAGTRFGRERDLVAAAVAVAAVAGAATGCDAVGAEWAGRVLAAAWAAFVTWGASRARRSAWLLPAALAAGTARPGWAVLAGAACLATGAAMLVLGTRSRPVGALVGAVAALALLHGSVLGPPASALLGVGVTAAVGASAYSTSPRRARRCMRRAAALGAVGAGLVLAGYGVALAEARLVADRGIAKLQAGLAAATAGDQAAAAEHLGEASRLLAAARSGLRAPWALPARLVPGVGPNADAVDVLAAVAADVADRGAVAVAAADLDDVRLRAGRLDLAAVDRVAPGLADLRDALDDAAADLAAARSPWLLPPVDDRLDEAATSVADATSSVGVAADAVEVLPALLGGEGTRRYFVAFVTPAEARGRTGFMGNFAELEATDGRVRLVRFGRTADLQAGGIPPGERRITGAGEYLARYGRFDPAATWQNVTMSPDLPAVAEVVAQLYPQSGGRPVDGVLTVDPAGLAALLTFTGPIVVDGLDRPLTAANAAGFLLEHQYLEVPSNARRVDLLEETARIAFERLTTVDLPAPRRFLDVVGAAVAGGHLQFVPFDAGGADLARRVGLDGALPPVRGDFLAVTANNAAGNKIDVHLERSLDYQVEWDPATGAVSASLRVTLTNRAPAAGLPDYVIGNAVGATAAGTGDLPHGTSRTFLTVYTPWTVEGAWLGGEPAEVEVQDELGRRAVSVFVDVAAGEASTLRLELSGVLDDPAHYVLDIAAQPLARPERATVAVHAREAEDVRLTGGVATVEGRNVTAALLVDRHRTLSLKVPATGADGARA